MKEFASWMEAGGGGAVPGDGMKVEGREEKKAISCHLSLQLFRHPSLPPFLNSGRQFDRRGRIARFIGRPMGRSVAHLGGWTAKRIFSVNQEQGS